MSESIKSLALSGAKWAMIEKFSLQIIQFAIGIVLARLLTPADYGTIGMLAVFFSISNVFIDSGFASALIRKKNPTESDYSTVFVSNLVISVVFFLLLVLIAPWVAKFYNIPILCPILRIQSISLLLYAFMAVQVTRLTAEVNFKVLARASLISSPLSGLIGICLAYIGWGVWALVAQNLIGSVLKFICLFYQRRWFPTFSFSRRSFDELFGFGKNMLGAGILSAVYFNLDSIVIGKFFLPVSLGNYARGTSIARLPVDNINGVLNSVTYPILAKLQDDTDRLLSAYKKYIALTSMCIFFCCLLMSSLGKPLILFLLSAKWNDAIIYLQLFSFAIMMDHLCVINLNLIKIKGRSDLIFKLEVVKRIVSFAILFAAIPFGVTGICISKIVYSLFAVYVNTYYNGKLFGMGFYDQFKDYAKYLVLSILACLPAYATSFLPFPNLVILIIGSFVSFSIYWYTLRKDPMMIELVHIVKSKISRK